MAKCQLPQCRLLAFRLAANHLLHFALLGTASIVPLSQGFRGLPLLARFPLCFFAFFLAQCLGIRHEINTFLLRFALLLPAPVETRLISSPRPCKTSPPGALPVLSFFQLRVFLHQLLQAEARELYRNLGFFTFSFALVHRTLAIFGMADLLSRSESSLTFDVFHLPFWQLEFAATRGKELGNVVDGVVTLARVRAVLLGIAAASPASALVFVFVRIMRRVVVKALCSMLSWDRRGARPYAGEARPGGVGGAAHTRSSRGAHILEQLCGNLVQKTRGHAGFGQICPVTPPVGRPSQDQRVHGSCHPDIAQAAFFFDVIRLQHCARVR